MSRAVQDCSSTDASTHRSAGMRLFDLAMITLGPFMAPLMLDASEALSEADEATPTR